MIYVLGIATLLGGIAAIWFFVDKYKHKNMWQEKEKAVNNKWLETSEIKKLYKDYDLRWANPDSIEERKQKGYEVVYEKDMPLKIKYRLINASNQVLIGIKIKRP